MLSSFPAIPQLDGFMSDDEESNKEEGEREREEEEEQVEEGEVRCRGGRRVRARGRPATTVSKFSSYYGHCNL